MIAFFSTILILTPRSSIAYALYMLANLIILRASKKALGIAACIIAVLSISFAINKLGYHISITAFALEVLLIFPVIYFIAGGRLRPSINPFSATRAISVGVMLLSVINMIGLGFPFRLPYIHYLPDAYGALFGLGGAKIVTIVGFFGLLVEYLAPRKSRLFIAIALLNFITPSYLLGFACGVAALGLQFIRRPKNAVMAMVIAAIATPYALARVADINVTFQESFGASPKVYAYLNTAQLFLENPSTLLIGTGAGQLASTPALWASDYMRAISSHEIPRLPGMYMSSFHDTYLGPALSLSENSFWALSSSFNKPYTSISTMLGELGLPMFVVMCMLFYGRIMNHKNSLIVAKMTIAFTAMLFLVDNWHDSLWFAYMIMLTTSANEYKLARENFYIPVALNDSRLNYSRLNDSRGVE